ncbi:hypothetical protein AXF42_Ash001086 [Apostasia shenzhenica]|uniref:Uncharacterized protein n=1 Tax=Apostasia shenzhenica TaxID=1088818 RepID=A0A2I0ATW3_9ASPA|nr:hypothetical protein AXF42_Ash001086 [Apostasia shenzhenica]
MKHVRNQRLKNVRKGQQGLTNFRSFCVPEFQLKLALFSLITTSSPTPFCCLPLKFAQRQKNMLEINFDNPLIRHEKPIRSRYQFNNVSQGMGVEFTNI